jgi:hypothetical protein
MNKEISNKSFGLLFFIVFVLIAIWPIITKSGPLRFWPIPISSFFLVLGLLNSKLLSPLNFLWLKFGELIGKIIAPIVMAIIYFVIITPIGIFMGLIGKDLLNIKKSSGNSYWIKRDKHIGSMKRQF